MSSEMNKTEMADEDAQIVMKIDKEIKEEQKEEPIAKEVEKKKEGEETKKNEEPDTALANFRAEVMKLMGDDGLFQVIIAIYLSILVAPAMESGILQQIMITLTPDHWCQFSAGNLTIAEAKMDNIPTILGSNDLEEFDKCRLYKASNRTNGTDEVFSKEIISCPNGWEYNLTIFSPSLTTENNWVCSEAWKEYFVISMFWTGSIFGPMVFGHITDRYGRKPAIILSYGLAGVAAVLTTLMTSFITISAARFLAGFPYWSMPILPYLWAMEFVSSSKRTLITFLWTISFSLSWVIFPWVAFFLRDWKMFVIITTAPVFLVLVFNSLLPESISWLTVRGNKKRISRTATQISIINRQNTNLELQAACDKYFASIQNEKKDPGLKPLITHPRLRKNFLLLIALMNISTVAFATLPHASSALSDSPYFSFSVASAFDCLGPIFQLLLLDRLGRRFYLSACFLLCALPGFAAAGLPAGYDFAFNALLISSRLFGVQSFCVVCLLMTEILPTELRGRGISVIQTFGAATSAGSPYIIYLKTFHKALPLMVIGALAMVGAVACMFLPETTDKRLPQTVEEGKSFGEGQRFWYIPCCHKPKRIVPPLEVENKMAENKF